jgi:hypothetical protein
MPRRQSKDEFATTITVHVPLTFPIYGGRKAIISQPSEKPALVPEWSNASTMAARPPPQRTENALIKALARAHRWRGKIESGDYSSISELATAESVNNSYACRLLRLTLLSPAIISDILDKRHVSGLMLKQLMKPIPTQWDQQPGALKIAARAVL